MIPSGNNILTTDLVVKAQTSKTYNLHIEKNIVSGMCDEREAMIQAIYKILSTERYEYVIYSWNYGIELADLYGKSVTYVCPELQRRIEEALLQDERIISVYDFDFDTNKRGEVVVAFMANTVFGDVEIGKVVNF